MKTIATRDGGPLRWRAAGMLAAHLPDTRGRDRLVSWTHGRSSYSGPVSGHLHNGLVFTFPDATDGAVRSLMTLRYRPPALASVLHAVLRPGDCFYDVGANYGIYTMWASPTVGVRGEVHAFEPVPTTSAGLQRLVKLNDLSNVVVVAAAAGATNGTTQMRTIPGASGLAHVVEDTTASTEVELTTLDTYTVDHRAPTLIKIDVEGHELAVLQGARRTLTEHRPVLVFEFIESHRVRSSTPLHAIPQLLAEHDYQIFNLTPSGLRAATQGTYTVNVLALSTGDPHHRVVESRLARTRFRRNQTT